jgi:hypothetical protein
MTSLQKIAMGLVITLVDAMFAGYDAVPDIVGWVMVVMGLIELRDRVNVSTLIPVSVVAGLVSLIGFWPDLVEELPESSGWLLSIPQLVVSFLLCVEVSALVNESLARRLRMLRWVFVVAAVGPVLLYGGGLDVTLVPLALLSVAANVYLVYLLFRASTDYHGPRVRLAREGHDDGPEPPPTR